MKLKQILITSAILFTFGLSWNISFSQENNVTDSIKVQNIVAFAKLYGYVRYFHPSDEASSIDWNKFAVYGVRKVENAKNTDDLKSSLEKLFYPIAPTIQIYRNGENPRNYKSTLPQKTKDLKVVTWQYLGYPADNKEYAYKKQRTNRKEIVSYISDFGNIMRGLDIVKYKGMKMKLKAVVKTEVYGSGSAAHLWIRVDGKVDGEYKMGFFNNMSDRPITNIKWSEYEITGLIDTFANTVAFGGFLTGMGRAWFDNFHLYIQKDSNSWEEINLNDGGFEMSNKRKLTDEWIFHGDNYKHSISANNPFEGEKCFLIETDKFIVKEDSGINVTSKKLFDKCNEIGDVFNKPLGAGLYCQVPLALYSDKNGTIGQKNEFDYKSLDSVINQVDYKNQDLKWEIQEAKVIVAWNVLQHFFPYFDVVNTDWQNELKIAVKANLHSRSETDFDNNLLKMLAKLHDGHSWYYKNASGYNSFSIPLKLDLIDGNVVIAASKDPNFKSGDLIVSVDGKKSGEIIIQESEYISGSKQWILKNILSWKFGSSSKNDTAELFLNRNDSFFTKKIKRINVYELYDFDTNIGIQIIDSGIYLINLSKVNSEEFDKNVKVLSESKGVIFDMRGYPSEGAFKVLEYLIDKPVKSAIWCIPQIIYPDHENLAGYDISSWDIKPAKPRFKGKIAFLTGPGAISAAETFMGIVEAYKLGIIIGQTTAGTNGNITRISLPDDYIVTWTSMKVLKHDHSQHHLIGIHPDITVNRTLKGVKEGRDEVLERALEYIKTGK